MEPSTEEQSIAKQWWERLPDHVKGNWSIWDILALYAIYTLKTRTVHFDADGKSAEV